MADQDAAYIQTLDLHREGRLQEAAAGYTAILRQTPKHPGALHGLGLAHYQAGQHDKAIRYVGAALAVQRDAEALNTLGLALAAVGRTTEALAAFDEAISLAPAYAVAFYNRGNTHRDQGREEAALGDYAKAIAIAPDLAEAHWNTGTLRLYRGEFENGWPEFEWRFKTIAHRGSARDFQAPLWTGRENLAGKTILLHAEQGLGDTIQFCRYAKRVSAGGANVLLEVQPPLVPLLRDLEGVQQLIARGAPLPSFDLHCPLMGLPLRFDTRLATIPADVPYLRASTEKIEQFVERLRLRADAPCVGLVWSGNPAHANDRDRSISLETLLGALPENMQYVSLQKDVRETDLVALRGRPLVDAAPLLADFSDTAAVISLLDVVITVDTAVAHLSGALGKPTWLLLPQAPDWRWLRERNDSPWYPTMRLFRQVRAGNWDAPLKDVRAALIQTGSTASARR